MQGCPRISASVCLVEHRSLATSKGGMLATSIVISSFLQAISAVMLWPVHVQRAPPASKHLYPAKLQSRLCDVCCTCQSICPFIPSDSDMTRPVDPQRSLIRRLCMAVWQSGQPIPDCTFCSRFIESVRMMACVACVSRWEASHFIACVT